MANTGFDVFDDTARASLTWIDQVCEHLGRTERQDGYQALRGVLHTLRDRMHVEGAADLGAQLPFLLRGVYYEGWQPRHVPVDIHEKDDFLYAVQGRMGVTATDLPAEIAIRAVLPVLQSHLTNGEAEHIHSLLPAGLANLWPERAAA